MSKPLTGTVIITGSNGSLGSEIALAIAKSQPWVHLLLTARNTRGEDLHILMNKIRLIGPRSVEVLTLDLDDLKSVLDFAQTTVERVKSKQIPPVVSLIHSAATLSYTIDDFTLDGYDPVYQTNCIAPFFLTVGLLEAFHAGDGSPYGAAKVINIGCSAATYGRLDYFDHDQGRDHRPAGTLLSAKEARLRFGSSKLLSSVALYALRRSLVENANIPLDIFTLDPGGIVGDSHGQTGAPLSVRVKHQTRSGLRPFLRMVSRSSMNKANVPAKVIAKISFKKSVVDYERERYYILDDEYEAGSVLRELRNRPQMGTLVMQMMQRLEGSTPYQKAPWPILEALMLSPSLLTASFQPRTQPSLRRRRQLFQRLCLVGGVSLLLIFFIFPSWRAVIIPSFSLGLWSASEDLHLQTVRYYDLSEVQGTEKGWERGERVLMLTPLRDAAPHLPMFFSHLRNLTYPHNLIDLAFLVSDSRDDTLDMLSTMLSEIQNDPDSKMTFGEISVIQKDFGQKVQQDVEHRHGFEAQASRRKLMAQARNWLLSATLRPTHSWVYWRDADVLTAPCTIIEDLMRHNKDVTVPNVWRPLPDWLGGEQPYDLNSWQESETALALADTLDEDAVIVEGYAEYATWRPHLAYLRDPYGDPDMEMELDGIGGVSILAKARVFRAGVHFPAFSFEKHAETEGFGKMAKRMKFSVFGLPHYVIWHFLDVVLNQLIISNSIKRWSVLPDAVKRVSPIISESSLSRQLSISPIDRGIILKMSTQHSRRILFTHTHPQQGFRLLELTPELEELLSSKDAPVLQIKSPSPALTLAVADTTAQEYINLCTPTKTYRIRQVQSSNSIHIILPSPGQISKEDVKVVEEADENGALDLPDEAVTTISKCGSTLELHVPAGGFSAIPLLEKSLQLYDRRDGDLDNDAEMEDESDMSNAAVQKLRDDIFNDIPVSTEQCVQGWLELCAFVHGNQGLAGWRPSAKARLNVWKRMMEGAALQGIDVEKQFLVGDLWKSTLDDDDDDTSEPFPRALLEAVVRKLCTADERPSWTEEIRWASFDKVECVRWVGETYLAATAPSASSAIGRSEFLRAWKDCLPESWRNEATLSKLQGAYQSPDPMTMFFVTPSQRQKAIEVSSGPPAAAGKATRNWHELLKNSKR
ncbi:hypothetical protein N7495_005440 [Penicillium taxi]|uniref:uncharacterized protein n=1 Tax=Penicillium taxi TaxID=168475 RepID=UPI0025456E2C|nr:uncharacterized protein N7495_005440 [Penicillium taxi]KAJ5893749.1 hypothetical protein N7495_005440 [Penicillium taxi]